ncbi:unnamed protein product [Phytophthora fragariaefolia]|uniref:Unnamed protein product n=1 Tax=Phytophthora fragariaefolia TaxID=1490495 RepID=A0A9W6XIU8_9STRA|nr:unnamed protein product [Phytophthora fragariaefolia]
MIFAFGKVNGTLVATGPSPWHPQDREGNNVCAYCDRSRHNIRQCRGLQKDLQHGRLKAGTVLPANFVFKGNSKRDHSYRNSKNWNQGRSNDNGRKNRRDKNNGSGRHQNGSSGKYQYSDQGKNRPLDSDSDDEAENGSKRKVFHHQHHDTGLVAAATLVSPPVSLTAQANIALDPTIDAHPS